MDIKDQKAQVIGLLQTIHQLEAVELLFGTVDREYLKEKQAELEWEYRQKVQALSIGALNKGNARAYPMNVEASN